MAIGNLNISGGGLEAYPIGSIYMSFNSTEPSILFGGTQERIKDRFILAAGDSYTAGATGGEATHEHTISKTNKVYAQIGNQAQTAMFESGDTFGKIYSHSSAQCYAWTHNRDAASTNSDVNSTPVRGTSDPASSMPPYLVAYMWYRTA